MIALLALAAAASAPEPVVCILDEKPLARCTLADTIQPDGSHRLVFTGGGRQVVFVGRSQSGWWSGMLDGRPAMGYERNRGNVVFSTTDLTHRFGWCYPREAHGTY